VVLPNPLVTGAITPVLSVDGEHHLEACSAFGETPDQALAEVERAKAAWLEAAREAGKPIPPPRYRPLIYQVAP
jgi:hypothetical protein